MGPLSDGSVDVSQKRERPAGPLRAALNAGVLGFVVAVVIAGVDFANAVRGDVPGGRADLFVGIASFLVAVLIPQGALLGLWLSGLVRLASRNPPLSQKRRWFFAGVAGLPFLLGAWWVPWSWLSENAAGLSEREKQLAVGVYLGLAIAVVVASRIGWWVHEVYQASPARLPKVHWPLSAGALLLAGACYWADSSVLVDLYEEFHYGLAGAFALGVAAFVVSCRALLRRSWPALLARQTPRDWQVFGGLSLLWLACSLAQFSRVSGARAAGALVFSKWTGTLLRRADFDGDRSSSLLGGLDCAAFDSLRGPAQVDLPNNGSDEDCTGSDARWPKPRPAAAYPIPDARGFNLLLITVDTLRADRMSLYGHTRRTTPNLERLAEQGLTFTRAYAQGSKTFESVPSLLTGLYPANLPRDYRHRRVRGSKAYMYTLTPDARTVTQLLGERGYQTRGFVSLGIFQGLGLDRGFDKLETVRDVTTKANRYLSGAAQPFFLWLHYVEPHSPYAKHAKYDFGDSELARYDSEIAQVDQLIGRVLKELERRGLADRTVVAMTADHGEEFGEHGARYHGNKPYEELLHVPLIIKVPGVAAARVDHPVELTDIAPSLCEVLALQARCDAFDGQSLWATLAGQRDEGPGFRGVYSEAGMSGGMLQRRSLLSEGFRLNVNLDTETLELFDEARDPREQRNVARAHPEKVAKLREEMALRPYRRLAAPFESALNGDTRELVQALPRVRTESLLRQAVELIAKHPSPGSAQALESLKQRPGLGDSVRSKLDALAPAKP